MAKKHLGQNFLKSGKALNDSVVAADISLKDTVFEIGPGKGALTEKLLASAGRVIAIEKDKDLLPLLEEKFHEAIKNKKLILQEDDILTYDLSKLPKKYKVVANIPYYITGAIIEKLLDTEFQPSCVVLVVQKEVAQRIVARDGKESILSMSVKVFGEPKFIGKIPARYFSPAPKVDSAILLIDNIKNPFKKGEKEKFFKLVKTGFGQKRKTLVKNLTHLGYTKENIGHIFKLLGLPLAIRSEKLTLLDWTNLASHL